MKLAAHGILADGTHSGAGVFPVLLRSLLERGDHVDFYGIRGYTQPRSLERFERYRFMPLSNPPLGGVGRALRRLPTRYPDALAAQILHAGYQKDATRRIEGEHGKVGYDAILCTDALALCSSILPVLCWPQSPPHTEGAALRDRDVARAFVKHQGLGYFAAVQLFYGYRWLVARAALDATDIFLCGSDWARSEWERFGAKPERLRTIAYPIDLEPFAGVPPIGRHRPNVTFLWLGRAVPRKRLDLFLAAFERLHRREPRARARLVGNLEADPFAAEQLAPYRGHPAISVEGVLARAGVPELFGAIDVLVQPSQNENFGFSVAEALAAGRAVVYGPTNGTGEYTGEAGFRFDAHTPDAVADAMQRALDAVLARGEDLTSEARRKAREHFALPRVVDRFSALCGESLARRGRPV